MITAISSLLPDSKVVMTRSLEEYQKILELWELGVNKSLIACITKIPRRTVIDCIQRYGNVERLSEVTEIREQESPCLLKRLCDPTDGVDTRLHQAYAYTLGIYLGDGNISKVGRVHRLRVTLDASYPNIIAKCEQELRILLPNNQIGEVRRYYKDKLSCIDVSAFYKYWTDVIPQHGAGKKHERKIELEAWQERITTAYPLEFFRGLYHSDGSRFDNVVNGKAYPRYQFTNGSTDIIRLFCETCDRLGVAWTSKVRQRTNPAHQPSTDIYISKRKDVEYLDRVVGAKS